MPALIRTIEQIVQKRRCDTYWVRFGYGLFAIREPLQRAREDQLAWFDDQGLVYEIAAPDGWLEGDCRCYAIYFEGSDDPRLHAYCAKFEQPEGGSLQPDLYQMYVVPFRATAAR